MFFLNDNYVKISFPAAMLILFLNGRFCKNVSILTLSDMYLRILTEFKQTSLEMNVAKGGIASYW